MAKRQSRRGVSRNSTQRKANFLGSVACLRLLVILTIVCTAWSYLSFAIDKWNDNYAIPESTRVRKPVYTATSFDSDCIVDELDWFDDTESTAQALQSFYDKTGVQPHIYLKAYDSSLVSDADKDDYAVQWYADNALGRNAFLYVYFGTENLDDVGYMCYLSGDQVASVMDDEAIEIFASILNVNWYSDMTTDYMFVDTFNATATRIMGGLSQDSHTLLYVMSAAPIVIIIACGIVLVVLRHRHQKLQCVNSKNIRR